MQGGKNWTLPKEMNANRFFWDSHLLEIWSNRFCPSMGSNEGSVAMDSVHVVPPQEEKIAKNSKCTGKEKDIRKKRHQIFKLPNLCGNQLISN
jgi:hypothetical protein